MKKYQIVRDCYGFKNRYWEKDEIVILEDNEMPPRHFQLIENIRKQTKDKEPDESKDKLSLSSLHNTPKLKTGMAYQATELNREEVVTAGSVENKQRERRTIR